MQMYYDGGLVAGGGTGGGGGLYYPMYNGPVYYNAPVMQPVDDTTLMDYIKKQMYEIECKIMYH